MKVRNVGLLLMLLGFLLNMLESWHFGWNMTARSGQEFYADFFTNGITIYGVVVMFTGKYKF